ncbi:MAG: serine--tRNA ligase, partial [Bacteroidales bacterium]|nr:serine--tRNA ligase [Bacteroidales bacterium]
MLSLQYIRANTDYIIERLKTRNSDYSETIEKLKELDDERRSVQQNVNNDQSELNTLSKKIGQLFKEGKTGEANKAKSRNTELKQKIKESRKRLNEIEEEIHGLLTEIPNVPHQSVIQGKGEEDNQLLRSGGKIPQLGEDALPHWELGKKYNILDFDLGNKITGRGFPVYKDKGSRLQRAMINYFLDKARAEGYKEMLPPLMVNEDSAFATGQLPDKEGQMYAVPIDNFYLIPTAEVPVTNIYRDSILEEKDLPVKMTAYTPCFRREAGSWGKEVRGLNRVHQFDKVEIVQIDHPESSYETLEEMTSYVENLIKALELPY